MTKPLITTMNAKPNAAAGSDTSNCNKNKVMNTRCERTATATPRAAAQSLEVLLTGSSIFTPTEKPKKAASDIGTTPKKKRKPPMKIAVWPNITMKQNTGMQAATANHPVAISLGINPSSVLSGTSVMFGIELVATNSPDETQHSFET